MEYLENGTYFVCTSHKKLYKVINFYDDFDDFILNNNAEKWSK